MNWLFPKKEGGFAFPVPGGCGNDEGMYLHDWIATQAMAAILATPLGADADKAAVAEQAYQYGAAMIEERKKWI